MRIEVQVKYARPIKNTLKETDEDKAAREARRIISGEDYEDNAGVKLMEMFSDENLEFFYKPYVLDTKDIHDFYPYDEEHTLIITKYSGQLPVKMAWIMWKAVWEAITGEVILQAERTVTKVKNNQKQL